MTTANKSFDCLEMMHAAALRIHEELKGKTREEQLAYWQERNEEARRNYPNMKEADPSGGARP